MHVKGTDDRVTKWHSRQRTQPGHRHGGGTTRLEWEVRKEVGYRWRWQPSGSSSSPLQRDLQALGPQLGACAGPASLLQLCLP